MSEILSQRVNFSEVNRMYERNSTVGSGAWIEWACFLVRDGRMIPSGV